MVGNREPATQNASMELRFGVRLVERFALLSGDRNPIHIDHLVARRLIFGKRVTHGMLVTLWVIACIRKASPSVFSVSKVTGSFKAPIFVGDKAQLKLDRDTSAWNAVVRSNGKLCATFRIEPCSSEKKLIVHSSQGQASKQKCLSSLTCHECDEAELSRSKGQIYPIAFRPEKLFRDLAGFNHTQCMLLAGLSRLVGMECPGLHSTLLGFDVVVGPFSENTLNITYQTTKFDDRFKFLSLAVSEGIRGRIDCYVRPTAVTQPTMNEVKELVPAGVFNGQHALIVGGSRGIGEVVAKSFAASGGMVTLTYAVGAEDATRVVADINSFKPHMANSINWDVLGRSPDLSEYCFTHGFFFATPQIVKGGLDRINYALYRQYRRFYVAGLDTVLSSFKNCSNPGSIFVYASSEFVEATPPGYYEYIEAKLEGEILGMQKCKKLDLDFNVWRLPRVQTDQTSAINGEQIQTVTSVINSRLKELVNS